MTSFSLYLYNCTNEEQKMKKLVLSLMLVVSTIMANEITVEVTDIVNKNGTVYIGLYNRADNFTIVSKNHRGTVADIDAKVIRYIFTDIKDGTYAISIFHDENSNKTHDKNFFGIPSEGYCFSNNIRPLFRSANFEESKFELNSDKNITIKMGY